MKIRSRDGFDDSIRPFLGGPFMAGVSFIYASKDIVFVFIAFFILLAWYYFYMKNEAITKKYWVECMAVRCLICNFLFCGIAVFFYNRFFSDDFDGSGFGLFFMMVGSVVSYPFLVMYGRSLMK